MGVLGVAFVPGELPRAEVRGKVVLRARAIFGIVACGRAFDDDEDEDDEDEDEELLTEDDELEDVDSSSSSSSFSPELA